MAIAQMTYRESRLLRRINITRQAGMGKKVSDRLDEILGSRRSGADDRGPFLGGDGAETVEGERAVEAGNWEVRAPSSEVEVYAKELDELVLSPERFTVPDLHYFHRSRIDKC